MGAYPESLLSRIGILALKRHGSFFEILFGLGDGVRMGGVFGEILFLERVCLEVEEFEDVSFGLCVDFPFSKAQCLRVELLLRAFGELDIEILVLFLVAVVGESREKGEAGVLLRDGEVEDVRHGGQDVVKAAEVMVGAACCNLSRPTGEHGGLDAAFVHVAFVPAESASGIEKVRIVAAFFVGTIVAGEHHDGVVVDVEFFQEGENGSDLIVEVFHHSCETCDGVHDVRCALVWAGSILPNLFIKLREDFAPLLVELLGGMHGCVGDGGGDVAEERCFGLSAVRDEVAGSLHDNGIEVGFAVEGDLFTITNVTTGVVGVSDELALPTAKFVESVGVRAFLSFFIGDAEAPFAKGSGTVSGKLKDLGKDDEFFGYRGLFFAGDVASEVTLT